MRNVLQELKENCNLEDIKCLSIVVGNEYSKPPRVKVKYRAGDMLPELEARLAMLNYDAGYGWQELFGTVWLDDGTWLERGEYDGSEWWEHKVIPAIPDDLA